MNESAKQFEPGELTQKELRKERLKTLAGMYQNKTRIWQGSRFLDTLSSEGVL